MELAKIKKEIDNLREQVRYHDWRYYALSDPEISDKEYDQLLKRLKTLEQGSPQLITPDSPTRRVSGHILEGFSTVRHKQPMLSLDNSYSLEELREWEEKLARMTKGKVSFEYVVELKVDGVSCSLLYEEGQLKLGATRGDGAAGEDITANLKTIKSIPLRLRSPKFPPVLEVRGEVYMGKSCFARINKQRVKSGEAPFANPRNAASGSLKLLDPQLLLKRELNCFLHSSGWREGDSFKTHNDFLDQIRTWGLRTNPHNRFCRNIEEVIDYCRHWEARRDSLDYEVDGVVVKINSFSRQSQLGATLKSPRWAVAYKFPAHQATTRIKAVDVQVGRSGILTPVGILEPVECAGVTISRSTLHNFEEIERLDVRVGDTVLIQRSGDVIPKVVKVIVSKRPAQTKRIKAPRRCPVCQGNVARDRQGEIYWYCTNPDCPAQLKRSLLHFASRPALDIEGMGQSVVEELVDKKIVKGLSDIYNLTRDRLLTLTLFKDKRADNLVAAIAKSKARGLARLLYGLGIKHVGQKAAGTLAEKFKDIDALFKLRESDLEQIPEIGPIMAASLVEFFSSSGAKGMIGRFKRAGLKLSQEPKKIKATPLSGKSFIFTGELEGLTRSQAQKLVESLGAKYVSALSRKVDYVVAGQNPGSKYEKAKGLGLKIINEAEFKKLTNL